MCLPNCHTRELWCWWSPFFTFSSPFGSLFYAWNRSHLPFAENNPLVSIIFGSSDNWTNFSSKFYTFYVFDSLTALTMTIFDKNRSDWVHLFLNTLPKSQSVSISSDYCLFSQNMLFFVVPINNVAIKVSATCLPGPTLGVVLPCVHSHAP